MDIWALKSEIEVDPLVRDYHSMDNREVADDMNTEYRARNKTRMEATEVANAINAAEWADLTTEERREIWDVLHMGSDLNPFGIEAAIFTGVFGPSTTISNLQDLRVESISRGVELELGKVKSGHVEMARGA